MATDNATCVAPPPSTAPAITPFQAWLTRLGLSGKILAFGGLAGMFAVFLPLLTMSVALPGVETHGFSGKGGFSVSGADTSKTVLIIENWRGVFCLFGYVGAIGLSYLLYVPGGLKQKNMGWTGAGLGILTAILAIWLLASAASGSSSVNGFGFGLHASVGFGAIANLLAALAITAGGFIKAREEKLI